MQESKEVLSAIKNIKFYAEGTRRALKKRFDTEFERGNGDSNFYAQLGEMEVKCRNIELCCQEILERMEEISRR